MEDRKSSRGGASPQVDKEFGYNDSVMFKSLVDLVRRPRVRLIFAEQLNHQADNRSRLVRDRNYALAAALDLSDLDQAQQRYNSGGAFLPILPLGNDLDIYSFDRGPATFLPTSTTERWGS